MDVEIIKGDTTESSYTIGIVVARWNSFVTDKLLDGALGMLKSKGYATEQVFVARCPGAYEIPFASRAMLPKVDGVITLGAVIRGKTPHFDYVCEAVNNGVMKLNMEDDKPVVFGVLTTDTVEQATRRANKNSDYGNKGAEAALALIEMLSLTKKLRKLKDREA